MYIYIGYIQVCIPNDEKNNLYFIIISLLVNAFNNRY